MQFLGSSCQRDKTRGTNIVVETSVFISVDFEQIKRKLGIEIFELNQNFWPTPGDCLHELFDKLFCFGICDSFLSKTEVQRVFEVSLIVCAVIKSDL